MNQSEIKHIPFGSVIGIIGGGQLGRMTAIEAAKLGYKTHIYTDTDNSCASEVAYNTTLGSYNDIQLLQNFAKSVDIVTFEFENIPHEPVKAIEEIAIVRPGYEVLHIAQNRIREKEFCNSININTAPFAKIESLNDLTKAFTQIGDSILKTNELGYDGKGQIKLNKNSDLELAWQELNSKDAILEKLIDFEKEISVIALKSLSGEIITYQAVENQHVNGILNKTIASSNISEKLQLKAQNIAKKMISKFNMIGILAIEMFVTRNGDILVNEIAPRPHNSGHWTMNGCHTCQFEQFVRAICGLPFGSVKAHSNIEMTNLIGKDVNDCHKYLEDKNTKLHLYGKKSVKDGRKMGHINKII